MDRHIWLVGMMGSGKTAVGRLLATRLGRRFVDTDAEVEARAGFTVADLWTARGEQVFRELEAVVVSRVATGDAAVISTGGGVVLRRANVDTMRETGWVIWLTAPPAVLVSRIGATAGRPLFTRATAEEDLAALLADRWDSYVAAADLIVDTDGLDVPGVVDRIEAQWNES